MDCNTLRAKSRDAWRIPASCIRETAYDISYGMNIKTRVAAVVRRHGSYRKAARETGVSAAQLCKLVNGRQLNPQTATLRKLGLMR